MKHNLTFRAIVSLSALLLVAFHLWKPQVRIDSATVILANQQPGVLTCTIHGQKGFGTVEYWRKAEFRSDEDAYRADVANLYEAGAARNIDNFYRNVTEGHFANDTVPRAVDSALTCILGREAAARGTRVTMEQILAESKHLEVNLAGLKT